MGVCNSPKKEKLIDNWKSDWLLLRETDFLISKESKLNLYKN